MDSPLRRLRTTLLPIFDRFAINRAVAYLLTARVWQFFTAPITALLIVHYFSEDLTGYYVAFTYLLAMQVFVELGLPSILLVVASHEWARLHLDAQWAVVGDSGALSRLAHLDRLANRWFGACSLMFFIGVGGTGIALLRAQPGADIHWLWPWVGAMFINALSLLYMPRISILEGCNQVARINGVRLLQAVTGTLVVWTCIFFETGLWVVMASNLVRWLWECYLVNIKYRRFFESLQRCERTSKLDWKTEILPLQWRIGLQSVVGFFGSYNFLILLAFPTQGAAVTGRIGMTWNVLASVQSVSLSWIQTRLPQFGMYVAHRNRQALNAQFQRIAKIAVGVFLLACGAFWLFLWALPWVGLARVQDRFLDLPTTFILILTLTALQTAMTEHYYVRIHKVDPFVALNLLSAGIVAGLFLIFGRLDGITGALAAYCAFCWLVTLPVSTAILIYYKRRFDREAGTDVGLPERDEPSL